MEEDARNSSDIALELARLHDLRGIEFTRRLQAITMRREFHLVGGEMSIYSALSESDEDFPALLNAAQRAVSHGYRVFILPNPRGIRTADFILEKKNVYKMYDLKTIHGRSSVGNRLADSKGQTNRVLLYMATDYATRLLTSDIRRYFEDNPDAIEVMVFKGKRRIVINRRTALNPMFFSWMRKMYE
jgi:hypothetical protein